MDTPLADRIALVTGASRGLGRAIALALAGAGAHVAVACKERVDLAEATAAEVRALGRNAHVLAADLADPEQTRHMSEACATTLGAPDLLVCNAGITESRLLVQCSADAWDRLIAVNLSGPARLCRELLPAMQERGRGAIVFVSSYAALRARPGLAAYAASKAGLLGLAKSLAREVAPRGITVNVVLPGYLETDMTRAAGSAAMAAARDAHLLHTLADVQGVAAFVAHLASASWLTGQVFNLDGRLLP